MEDTSQHNEQATLWNGPAARAWIDGQALLDEMLRPFQELLLAEVAARRPRDVLDIGCGTGSTTIAIAAQLGEHGRVLGADLSAPMIEYARERAAREGSSATFIAADAQRHAFVPASANLLVSRFGVMFFDDPVAAFRNLRGAARDHGELVCVVWRSAADNPFMTTAERTVAPMLPALPPRRPDGPGQFAFADRDRVNHILTSSGWRDVDLQPLDVPCAIPASSLMPYVTRMGPVGMALQSADDTTRVTITDALRTAFQPFVDGDQCRFTAACWKVTAHAAG